MEKHAHPLTEDQEIKKIDSINVEESESDPEYKSESGSEDDEDDVQLMTPSDKSIYRKDGLLEKLDDISWPHDVDWIHKLSVDVNIEQGVDVNDDLVRELALYNQALMGAREGFEKVESLGIPFLRPPDYYAEMVKSDTHMEKVKGRLLQEKTRMEEVDERRKAREAKKMSKEVQAQKLRERSKEKKEGFESVKKWRKQRQRSGFGDKDKDLNLDLPSFTDGFDGSSKKGRPGVAFGDRSGGKGRGQIRRGGKGMKMDKRGSRDSKYGFGGRKGMNKQNTAESTSGFKGSNKGFAKKRKR